MTTLDLTGLAPADVDLLRQLAERMKGPAGSEPRTIAERTARFDEALRHIHDITRQSSPVVEFDRGDIYDRDTP